MPLWLSRPIHKIRLDWTLVVSGGAVACNIYRGFVSGGPYTLLAGSQSSSPYFDFQVNPSQTYFYVFTAIDGLGGESVKSAEISGTVGGPL